jgi:hypothetical protein
MDVSKTQLEMLTKTGVGRAGNRRPERDSGSRPVGQAALGRGACETAGRGVSAPRTTGRHALVFELLRRPRGASVSEIATATDWRARAVRAFLSDLPLVLEELPDGERRYHIAALVEPHRARRANLIAR